MHILDLDVSVVRCVAPARRRLLLTATFLRFGLVAIVLASGPAPLSATTLAALALPGGGSPQSQKQTGEQLLSLLQARQLEQAISLGQQAVARWPQSADFHHWLGIAYFRSGKNAEALEQLAQAGKLRPEDYDIHYDTALVHLQDQK